MTQRLEIDWDGRDAIEFVVKRGNVEYTFTAYITDFEIDTTYDNPIDIYTPPFGRELYSRPYRTFTLRGSINDGIGTRLKQQYKEVQAERMEQIGKQVVEGLRRGLSTCNHMCSCTTECRSDCSALCGD